MAYQLLPISPPVHVTISDPAGGTAPGLLLAVRFEDEAQETDVLVALRHHGLRWMEQGAVLESWSGDQ